MSLSCYIVDDEGHAARVLGKLVSGTEGLRLAGMTTKPLDAMRELSEGPLPDIVFLDIDMPRINGIKLASAIKGRTNIIFTTSYRDYAPDAFDVGATDYLLKPISLKRFLESVARVKAKITMPEASAPSCLFLKTGARTDLMRVPFEEIVYISGLESYSEIHLADQKHVVFQTLKELTERLPAAEFSRVHRSYIVGHRHIRLIKGQLIALDQQMLPIGRAFRKAFMDKLPGTRPGDPAF